MRALRFAILSCALVANAVSPVSAFAETIGVLPFRVDKGLVLPLSLEALEDSLTRGLQTSGYPITPSSSYTATAGKTQSVDPVADFLVQTNLENAGAEGIAITLDLLEKGGRRINRERSTCMEPDCSLGGALRLMGKQLVRLGLLPDRPIAAPAPSPSSAPVDPVVKEPVANPASATVAPAWAWPVMAAGGASLLVGVTLLAIHGNGTDCNLANDACRREFDTRSSGTVLTVLGAVGVGAGAVGALWLRNDQQTVSLAVLPTVSGLSILGRY